MAEPDQGYLVVDGVSKAFGRFRALDGVDLTVAKASIHAVLGENGAGKTSLMNVLYGLYRPDQGEIRIAGHPITLHSPADAIRHRIGMIHQHFHLAEALTVTENIMLGLGRPLARLRLADHAARIAEMSRQIGFEVDPAAEVWRLPMGMRQRVEILKALYRGADILVLDEPTSVLAPSEIDGFLASLRRLRADGTTILFVTHKLDEVMAVADEASVMRAGKVVARRPIAKTSPQELSRLMIGRELSVEPTPRTTKTGVERLVLRDLVARNDRGGRALDELSLSVRAGEVLGIVGIDGNGQRELAEVITGLRPLVSGHIAADGCNLGPLDARARQREARIGFVPEDRHGTGLVLDHSVETNLILRSFDLAPVSRHGLLDRSVIAVIGKRLAAEYDIRLRSPRQPARDLSGGNQQKIILAREIEAAPRILVIAQATKGLDLGAIAFVQRQILAQREKGVAILYISTELEHVMEVADRIGVICAGRITGELTPQEASAERIGLLMAGVTAERAA
ncbi:ABC transporter ATP-binding protein [Bosea sp. LjRoot90]|uniref:ABC transporter ATP-binding protein n=1 Tax=Bosea sp. LjRoot90 TaxID=3342342 RepID=UPI003ECF5E02